MWDVFAKKKNLRKSILTLWQFFSQSSFASNTAMSDKHKGGTAVTAIITQFYFSLAHLKST